MGRLRFDVEGNKAHFIRGQVRVASYCMWPAFALAFPRVRVILSGMISGAPCWKLSRFFLHARC